MIKRLLLLLIIAAGLSVSAHAQSASISGTLTDPTQTATTTNTFARFRLQNYSGAQPRITGTSLLAKTQVDFLPNTSGVFSGVIEENAGITPPGTYYTVEIWNNGKITSSANYIIASSPWSLNTATPLVSPPAPFGYVYWARTYVYTQSSASLSWPIPHGFGSQNVVVQCTDSNFKVLIPDTIVETDVNDVTVTFVSPQTGACIVMNAGNVVLTGQPGSAIVANPNGPQTITGYPLSVPALVSSTGGPVATTGFIEMSSSNTIDWASNVHSGQNIALSKDTADYLHINGAAWQQDCPTPGVASCSGGLTIFSNNENPGVSSHGWQIVFQQNNSAGTMKFPVIQNCGFADVTAGAEQGVCDFQIYIDGTQQVMALGGTLGGGNVPILSPSTDNLWYLGQASTRFKGVYAVTANLSAASYGETTAPTGVAGFDVCNGSSTVHQIACDNNNQGYFSLVQTGNILGVHSDSGFLMASSGTGCTTGASIGGTCASPTTITWPQSFADTSYLVSCQGVGAITNFPIVGTVTISSASAITVQTMALTAAAASFTSIHCVAVHQ